jgi:hypothetical protein
MRLLVLLAVVALLLLPTMTLAQDRPPDPPCRFYGTVEADGQPVPDGTVITAVVEGEPFETTVPAEYGPSTYAIKIIPSEGTSYDANTTLVSFTIGDASAKETHLWVSGGNVELDLTVGEPLPTPGPGGPITDVDVETLAAGENARAEYDAASGKLTLYIPAGAKGDKGDTGEGEPGEPGKDAPIAIPIVALVLAVIAVGVAAMAMRRKT